MSHKYGRIAGVNTPGFQIFWGYWINGKKGMWLTSDAGPDDWLSPNPYAIYHVFSRHPVIDGERTLVIGHAVRTDKYRFISWRMGWGLQGDEYAAELYDYSTDQFETTNVVDDPNYASIRKDMEKLLMEGPAGRFWVYPVTMQACLKCVQSLAIEE